MILRFYNLPIGFYFITRVLCLQLIVFRLKRKFLARDIFGIYVDCSSRMVYIYDTQVFPNYFVCDVVASTDQRSRSCLKSFDYFEFRDR